MIREYNNLTIIGTSHVARESARLIRDTVEQKAPTLIAVELDRRRAYGLLTKDKKTDKMYILRKFGLSAFILFSIGEYVQKNVGKALQIEPGADMLAAIRIANEKKIPFALIDRDIEITLRRLSKGLTWTDKKNFIKDLFKREKVDFDISRVPSYALITELLKTMRERYPGLYKVLIEERNHIMAERMIRLSETHNTLAVIGAGHLEGICSIIEKHNA